MRYILGILLGLIGLIGCSVSTSLEISKQGININKEIKACSEPTTENKEQ